MRIDSGLGTDSIYELGHPEHGALCKHAHSISMIERAQVKPLNLVLVVLACLVWNVCGAKRPATNTREQCGCPCACQPQFQGQSPGADHVAGSHAHTGVGQQPAAASDECLQQDSDWEAEGTCNGQLEATQHVQAPAAVCSDPQSGAQANPGVTTGTYQTSDHVTMAAAWLMAAAVVYCMAVKASRHWKKHGVKKTRRLPVNLVHEAQPSLTSQIDRWSSSSISQCVFVATVASMGFIWPQWDWVVLLVAVLQRVCLRLAGYLLVACFFVLKAAGKALWQLAVLSASVVCCCGNTLCCISSWMMYGHVALLVTAASDGLDYDVQQQQQQQQQQYCYQQQQQRGTLQRSCSGNSNSSSASSGSYSSSSASSGSSSGGRGKQHKQNSRSRRSKGSSTSSSNTATALQEQQQQIPQLNNSCKDISSTSAADRVGINPKPSSTKTSAKTISIRDQAVSSPKAVRQTVAAAGTAAANPTAALAKAAVSSSKAVASSVVPPTPSAAAALAAAAGESAAAYPDVKVSSSSDQLGSNAKLSCNKDKTTKAFTSSGCDVARPAQRNTAGLDSPYTPAAVPKAKQADAATAPAAGKPQITVVAELAQGSATCAPPAAAPVSMPTTPTSGRLASKVQQAGNSSSSSSSPSPSTPASPPITPTTPNVRPRSPFNGQHAATAVADKPAATATADTPWTALEVNSTAAGIIPMTPTAVTSPSARMPGLPAPGYLAAAAAAAAASGYPACTLIDSFGGVPSWQQQLNMQWVPHAAPPQAAAAAAAAGQEVFTAGPSRLGTGYTLFSDSASPLQAALAAAAAAAAAGPATPVLAMPPPLAAAGSSSGSSSTSNYSSNTTSVQAAKVGKAPAPAVAAKASTTTAAAAISAIGKARKNSRLAAPGGNVLGAPYKPLQWANVFEGPGPAAAAAAAPAAVSTASGCGFAVPPAFGYAGCEAGALQLLPPQLLPAQLLPGQLLQPQLSGWMSSDSVGYSLLPGDLFADEEDSTTPGSTATGTAAGLTSRLAQGQQAGTALEEQWVSMC